PADEHPLGRVGDTRLDAIAHIGTRSGSERRIPRLAVGPLGLLGVAVKRFAGREDSSKNVVVLPRNGSVSEGPKERAKSERLVRDWVGFHGQPDAERHLPIRAAKGRESLTQPAWTGEQV